MFGLTQGAISADNGGVGAKAPGRAYVLILFVATIFLSAALLFVVEPMFARMALPLLGGSPAVWNTALVFYQAVLLLGYAYAHALSRITPRRQAMFHSVVLLLPALALPIAVAHHGLPPGGGNPIPWLLGLLVSAVGLPFFVVSTGGSLLQRWFARTGHGGARDPYFLYAASNLGSLLGLLAYPLIIEPGLTVAEQSYAWTIGYVVLAGLTLACAWLALRPESEAADLPDAPLADAASDAARAPIPWQRCLRWVLWAFVPSSLLLGVTTHLTSDVGSLPLLWVIPLALYLVTFTVAFGKPGLAPRNLIQRALALVTVLVTATLAARANEPFAFILGLDLALLVLTGLLFHGMLAEDRPGASELTGFYLWVALGGVLGGGFNALLAPLIFSSVAEYPIVLVLACLVAPAIVTSVVHAPGIAGVIVHADVRRRLSLLDALLPALAGALTLTAIALVKRFGLISSPLVVFLTFVWPALLVFSFSRRPLRFGLGVAAMLLAASTFTIGGGKLLHEERSFFGVHRVIATVGGKHLLLHGSTFHGLQWIDPAKHDQPLSYYHREGPFGQIFADRAARKRPLRVGLVGLGAGALVAYAHAGDSWAAYEIDPVVDRLARDRRYFTYIADAPVPLRTVLGDGRLSLAADSSARYDVLVLDAYSSDAIPVHLLTREAIALYMNRLAPGGILAFNLSNRHLDLEPVLAAIALDAHLVCRLHDDIDVTPEQYVAGRFPARVAVVARAVDDLGGIARDRRWIAPRPQPGLRLWTDDYSSLLPIYQTMVGAKSSR